MQEFFNEFLCQSLWKETKLKISKKSQLENKASALRKQNDIKGVYTLRNLKNRFFLFHFLKVYHFKNILSKFHKGMSIIYGDIRV